jgi:membrane protein
MQIPDLTRFRFVMLMKKAYQAFRDDDMPLYAAALAYHVLFSFFPFVLLLVSLLGFFGLTDLLLYFNKTARTLLSKHVTEQLAMLIEELRIPQGGLLSFGVVVAVWMASRATRALMRALNVAYGVPRSERPVRRYTLSVLYTFGIIVLLVSGAGLLTIGPSAMQWMANRIGAEQIFVLLWTWLRWPVGILLLMLAVAIVYYIVPNASVPFRLVTPGAVLSVSAWIAASAAFGFYLENFADYTAIYGSIGIMIALLLYLHLSAAILLFGAELNAARERMPGDSGQ